MSFMSLMSSFHHFPLNDIYIYIVTMNIEHRYRGERKMSMMRIGACLICIGNDLHLEKEWVDADCLGRLFERSKSESKSSLPMSR